MLLASSSLFLFLTATGWAAGARWGDYAKRSDDWYRGDDGKQVTANILSH